MDEIKSYIDYVVCSINSDDNLSIDDKRRIIDDITHNSSILYLICLVNYYTKYKSNNPSLS